MLRLLASPSDMERTALRRTMLHCMDNFPSYLKIFAGLGIERADICSEDPMRLLGRLPVMNDELLRKVSAEAVSADLSIVDTETSSGTTGGTASGAKIRFITSEDDRADHEFLAALLSVCGIGAGDRVACVDTDPAAVMVSFPRACEILGVSEAYSLSVGADPGQCIALMERLRPTVLISVPSIIERLIHFIDGVPKSLKESINKAIYIGEGMSDQMRSEAEFAFGAEVFSYYGSSETSALGVECRAHAGVHIYRSRHILEMRSDGSAPDTGDLILTTLAQHGLPLLRYRLGDRITMLGADCGCGSQDPLISVLGRSGLYASILGSKIHYQSILGALLDAGLRGPLRIVLDSVGGREIMRLLIADSNSGTEGCLLNAVLDSNADIGFLSDAGMLDVRLELRPIQSLAASRKTNALIDRRRDV